MRTSVVSTRQRWWLVPAAVVALLASAAHAKDLGDILVDKGLITPEELKQAQEDQKEKPPTETSSVTLPKWLGVISPFGDVRLRDEGFYGNTLHARTRFRLRARIGLTANVTDEIAATVRLASGDANDPISTNQTLSNTFTRKPINLDQAYLTLKPGKSFGLEPGWITVYGGKVGVNAYRVSELVFDDDLSPEGATETANLWERKTGFLRGIRLNAFEWVLDELAADKDPWIGGGQAIVETALGNAAAWNFAFADYNFVNLNQVASKFLNPYSDPPTNSKPNASYNSSLAQSNDVVKNSKGKIIGYKSGFNVINGTTELNFPDPVGLGIPAGVFGDVAYNTQADGKNVGAYVGFGIGKAGKDWYHDALKNVGDWGVAYTYAWVEKNAVLSLFSLSELDYLQNKATQKGATNAAAHILRLDYQLLSNFQITAKAEFINALDRAASNATLKGNPTLVRTQLDAVLKF